MPMLKQTTSPYFWRAANKRWTISSCNHWTAPRTGMPHGPGGRLGRRTSLHPTYAPTTVAMAAQRWLARVSHTSLKSISLSRFMADSMSIYSEMFMTTDMVSPLQLGSPLMLTAQGIARARVAQIAMCRSLHALVVLVCQVV